MILIRPGRGRRQAHVRLLRWELHVAVGVTSWRRTTGESHREEHSPQASLASIPQGVDTPSKQWGISYRGEDCCRKSYPAVELSVVHVVTGHVNQSPYRLEFDKETPDMYSPHPPPRHATHWNENLARKRCTRGPVLP